VAQVVDHLPTKPTKSEAFIKKHKKKKKKKRKKERKKKDGS
jgi:hypothetical protein